MNNNFTYYDREQSWLSFNYRVLQEAMDDSLDLYERIKFVAIYHSNLDEFYRVRVASYRSLLSLPSENFKKLNFEPELILENINNEVIKQYYEFENLFTNKLLPELESNNIILKQDHNLFEKHTEYASQYFLSEILSYLQPVLLTKGDVLSFLQDNVIYLAVKLEKKRKKKNSVNKIPPQYAIIKVPSHKLPRFIELPKVDNKFYIIFIEDIIRNNLNILFPGYIVDSSYCIKISRNADIPIDDEFQGNILEKIRKSISKRKTGMPARFLYDKNMPPDFISLLKIAFNLSKKDFVPSFKYLNLHDLFELPNPLSPKLERVSLPKLHHYELDIAPSILKAVREKEYILHFPYHSYDYVLRFFNEAAIDPKVDEIKTTQYRVATNSAIVSALISAARNGKKVTVFIEFKARFDEAANIKFAESMAASGIHVIPSLPGLKVHAKSALVLRRPSRKDGTRKGIAFISTGNFNEKTALTYADHGFFTSDEELVNEVDKLFYHLENPSSEMDFYHFLVPKYNLRSELYKKIDKEITYAKKGLKAYILIKVNSIEDIEMINKLYEASINGVKIDLIIRGICRIVPGEEFSKNIKVIRIVDKYLEHARIFVFHNNGKNDLYISSADLMERNLNRRIELVTPIYNQAIKNELLDLLELQLKDNVKAKILGSNLYDWKNPENNNKQQHRSQIEIYNYLKNKNDLRKKFNKY
ncbi:MAG: polyphosphate kinase 1 [Bacteroidales bacterium]|nr:polyphosphate kinase 1 [Bacteroidales bacterium]MBN2758001.1 polyphosphate kinase 1 [Bacteroidales bacterium]